MNENKYLPRKDNDFYKPISKLLTDMTFQEENVSNYDHVCGCYEKEYSYKKNISHVQI